MLQDKFLYEYAVIRVIPSIEREEFINTGIILFSKQAAFIKMTYVVNEDKLKTFTHDLDIELVKETLCAFEKICNGEQAGGHIASFDIPERFRWLTSVRSSSIQTSRPHPGFASDLDLTLEKLFKDLVI